MKHKIIKKRHAAVLAVIVLMVVLFRVDFALGESPKFKLKVATIGGPKFSHHRVTVMAMKIIEEKTKGGITFDHYPGGSLFNLAQTFDAISKNVVQMGHTFGGTVAPRMGIIGDVAALPFTYDTDKWHAGWRKPGSYYDFAEPLFNKNNLHLLTMPKCPYGELQSRIPIRKMEDMKGLMVRAFPGLAPAIKYMGANTVYMPLAELYTAFQRGTVDAGVSSLENYVDKKRYEVAPYLIISHFYASTAEHVINLEVYNSLPPEWRKIMDDAFLEAEQWWASIAMSEYEGNLKYMKEKGVNIYYLPPNELARWKEGVKPIWKDLAKKWPKDYPQLKRIIDELEK